MSNMEKAEQERWSADRAWEWHKRFGWLLGANFVPSTAGNQLEMWQAETFDPATIDRELGWLAELGMNSMRVFLHDLAWQQDPAGFLGRLDRYLEIAARHRIGTMFVFFDSVWHPFPRVGRQPEPEPGVHNSIWLQSPGLKVLRDAAAWNRLEDYISDVMHRFREDERVQVWDLWNEPDNSNDGSYGPRDLGPQKAAVVLPLLKQTFAWARAVQAIQPLTSGVWWGYDWNDDDRLAAVPKFQLRASDIISFHRYEPLALTRESVEQLKKLGRPVVCTEYLARGPGNSFQAVLPYFREEGIGAYNWGAVSGRSQTIYPWGSWQDPDTAEPTPWHHDILRPDGTPYDAAEAELLREQRRLAP